MSQWQIQVPIGNLPLQLVCLSDASIAFVKTQDFTTILEDGASFSNTNFSIDKVDYEYNTKIYYKQLPSVLKWLIDQKLPMPIFN